MIGHVRWYPLPASAALFPHQSSQTSRQNPRQSYWRSDMKAVALTHYLPIDNPNSFLDVELEKPTATGHDILVAVHAVAVNPVDTKVRAPKDLVEASPRVIGYDASGIVDAVGPDVTLFKVGDPVYYAGDITRPGTNQQFHLVDERIVGHKPATLSHAEAAALPLTTITAYEAFFDRLGIDRNGADKGQTILIIGASGGVGSIGIQLAKQAGLIVIATASRPETTAWVTQLGADHVISHRGDMVAQTRALGIQHVDHVAVFNDMGHWDAAVELIRPQGGIVSIDNTDVPMPMAGMKMKAASLHWEFMFARAMHKTPDMIEQHNLLSYVAGEIDAGRIRTTVSNVLSPINAAKMREAHRLIETGTAKGKIVIEGF
jgi:NADPH2:quinone reductase